MTTWTTSTASATQASPATPGLTSAWTTPVASRAQQPSIQPPEHGPRRATERDPEHSPAGSPTRTAAPAPAPAPGPAPAPASSVSPASPAGGSASTDSQVLSLRIDSELFDRLQEHAAKRGMSVQDYVVRTLIRDDFDERFKASVDETKRFYDGPPPGA